MKTRKLGFTNLELTTVGLGTWAIGGPWEFGWGPQDDDDSIAAILEALECGINWIDTAPIYGFGRSESIVGKALAQVKTKPLIATKCGLVWKKEKRKLSCLKKKSILDECKQSLERLSVDVIDLYQIHWPEPDEDIEQAVEAMMQLVDEGKIRYIGVSNFSVKQIQKVAKIAPLASLQPTYSMIHRGVEQELLGFCRDNNIGVVVYSPMERGLLTGKFDHKRLKALPPGDHRITNPDFQEPRFSATLQLVEKLRPIADRIGCTLAQLAIAWTLRRPEVTSAIVGARKSGQICETAKAGDIEIPTQELEKIEQLLHERQEKTHV